MALKWLRDQMKYLTWVLWIIVAAFIFALFFDFSSTNVPQAQNEVAATVGSEKITYVEFRRQYQNLEGRYRQMFGDQWSNEMAEQFNLPKQALDQLIDRRIRLMEADEVGLEVTDSEVQKAIMEFPVFQDENGDFIGREKVQQVLRANRLTDAGFAEDLRDDLLVEKLSRVLSSTLYLSDEEVQEAYKKTVEKADIQFVQMTTAALGDTVTATEQEIQAYFDEHATEYELPEQRVVDYILVDTVKMRRELEIADDELKQYYDANPDEFTQEEQVMARHILMRANADRDDAATEAALAQVKTRIEGGEDFATLARELSDDEGSAQRGGSLGFFKRGDMVKPFEDAAFNAQPGTLVGPVKTSIGYHLIEVQQHRQGGLQDFEQTRGIIRSKLLGQRVDEMAEDKVNELAQKIKAESLTETDQLKTMAEEAGVTFETTEPFGKSDAVVGIGRVALFANAVFDLKSGEISDPVKVPRGWAIARLAEVKEPRIPELATVEDQVRRAVVTEKQKEQALESLREAKAKIASGDSDFATVAGELGLEVQTSGSFGSDGNVPGLGRNPEVVQAALSMEVGEVSEPLATGQGAVLFEVLDRTKFDPAEFEEQKETTRTAETNRRLSQMLSSVVEQRRRDLAPKYDARVVRDFGIQDEG